MNTNNVLKYGHQTVLQIIEGLPEAGWRTPGVCGVWSVKDVIAHLASFDQLLVEVLNSLLDDRPTPTLDKFREDYVRFNDAEVIKRRNNTIREVCTEYEEAHAQTVALMNQIPAKTRRQNGTLSWYGPEYNLDDFIVFTCYGHKRELSAHIAEFRHRVKI